MKTRILVVMALIGLGVLVAASILVPNLNPGKKAPSFTLPTLDGKTFTLRQPGKVVLMDIWATWCPPCRAEIPFVMRLNKKYAGKDVVFVGVSVDQRKGDVTDFAKELGVRYTIALDPGAQAVGGPYKVEGIPATYLIDKKGVIRYSHSGFGGASDAEKMDREIATLLAE